MSQDDKKYWLDEPGNVKKIIWALFVVCGALFIADAFYHKHSHFGAEDFFGLRNFRVCRLRRFGDRSEMDARSPDALGGLLRCRLSFCLPASFRCSRRC